MSKLEKYIYIDILVLCSCLNSSPNFVEFLNLEGIECKHFYKFY